MWSHKTVDSRITPACAGNSIISSKTSYVSKDHPRVCGEQHTRYYGFHRCLGSPPRVRGTVILILILILILRITPACAGNSLTAFTLKEIAEDHPRVCGEQRCD